jgi:hypothetical protein
VNYYATRTAALTDKYSFQKSGVCLGTHETSALDTFQPIHYFKVMAAAEEHNYRDDFKAFVNANLTKIKRI